METPHYQKLREKISNLTPDKRQKLSEAVNKFENTPTSAITNMIRAKILTVFKCELDDESAFNIILAEFGTKAKTKGGIPDVINSGKKMSKIVPKSSPNTQAKDIGFETMSHDEAEIFFTQLGINTSENKKEDVKKMMHTMTLNLSIEEGVRAGLGKPVEQYHSNAPQKGVLTSLEDVPSVRYTDTLNISQLPNTDKLEKNVFSPSDTIIVNPEVINMYPDSKYGSEANRFACLHTIYGLDSRQAILYKRLGAGAMGEAFLGIDKVMGPFVLKVCPFDPETKEGKETLQLMKSEAKTLSQLKKIPNIVIASDFKEQSGHLMIKMDYVPGSDLDCKLAENGPINEIDGTRLDNIRKIINKDNVSIKNKFYLISLLPDSLEQFEENTDSLTNEPYLNQEDRGILSKLRRKMRIGLEKDLQKEAKDIWLSLSHDKKAVLQKESLSRLDKNEFLTVIRAKLDTNNKVSLQQHGPYPFELEVLRLLMEDCSKLTLDTQATKRFLNPITKSDRAIFEKYLKNRFLDEKIDAIKENLEMTKKIATALGIAHKKSGIVHSDIKPSNIMVSKKTENEKPEPFVIDYGIAKKMGNQNHEKEPASTWALNLQSNTTKAEVASLGTTVNENIEEVTARLTPLFMSPEQARNLALDGRSDIYSLGASNYMIYTGKSANTYGKEAAITFDEIVLRTVFGDQAPDPFEKILKGDIDDTLRIRYNALITHANKITKKCLIKALERDGNNMNQEVRYLNMEELSTDIQCALDDMENYLDDNLLRGEFNRIRRKHRNKILTFLGGIVLSGAALVVYDYISTLNTESQKLAEKNATKVESGNGYSLIVSYKNEDSSFNLSETLFNLNLNESNTNKKTFNDVQAANLFELRSPDKNNQAELLVSFIQIFADTIKDKDVEKKVIKVDWYDVTFKMIKNNQDIWVPSEFNLTPRHSAAFSYNGNQIKESIRKAFEKAHNLKTQSENEYQQYKSIGSFLNTKTQ